MSTQDLENQIMSLDYANIGLKTARIVARGLVHHGMVIAPVEPTDSMLAVGVRTVFRNNDESLEETAVNTYKEMIKVRRDRG